MTNADDVTVDLSALFKPPVRSGEVMSFARAAPPQAAPVRTLINSRRLVSIQIGRRRLVALSAVHAMLRAESESA